MDSIFEKNLITTKDAGELSGYSSDYLARLARSGKIEGKRIGHSWLIDKDSLAHFIDQQGDRKIDYARALARTRETEYRKHNSLLHNAAETLSKPITVPQTNILGSIVHSQAFALSVAGIVVVSGAFAANAAAFPQIANQALAIAHEAAFGFNETFGNIPSNIASRINATTEKINTISPRVAENTKSSSANIATSLPVVENLSSLRLATTKNPNTVHSYQPTGIISPTHATESAITIADIQSFARTLCTFVLNPSHAVGSLSDAYTTIGLRSYAAISTSLSSYRSLIELSGINSLKLASYTRDSISASPLLVSKINLALGNAIINGTHAAIRADVATAYGISTAVPNGGRAVIALVVGTGNLLANSTARTPALATALYLHTTEIPAKAGPALARAVFNVEYGVSARFVKDTNAVSGSYALALRSLGEAGYSGTTGTLALIQEVRHRQQLWMSDFHNIPIALQDAYLGALGKSALAIDSIIRIPQVATVISASSPSTKTVLVLGKQVALITYKTINDLFNSATRTLATLFVQPTPIVAPTIQKTRTITVAPTTTYNLRPSTSYPTYTTVINGISDDFLNQSLASLRTNILATVENISYKVEKNSSYLTSLIVKNGDFRGGVFDKGTMTNGISVSATTGTFTNLTAQTTSLATTTITGDLSVSGTITPEIVSAGTSISAPYFTATSTTNNTFPNLIATSATTTNSTSTNLYSSSLIAGNATSTNFFATLGHFTTGIVDTFSSTLATIIGATFTNSTTTNATTTGSFALTSATPSRFLSLTSNGVATSTNLSSWLAGTTNQITMTDNGTGGLTASLPSLVALNNASSSQFSAFQKSYFGATATSTFDSAGVLTLASALAVTSGGTGWSAIQSGAIPYGNDAGAVSTTTTATNGNILAWLNNIPTPLATSTISTGSGISVSGTGALVNAGGLTITNTGVLSLQQLGGGTAQTGALTFATSTVTTNGQTLGIAVTNSSGAFTFTPTISGTLDNSGLTNSTIALSDSNSTLTIGGTPASLGGTLTATLNLAHSNIWTALQSFANASTSQLSVFNKAYFGGTATSTFDSAGALTLITPLLVSSGGTGQTSFTSGNLLYGAGTGAIQNVATTTIAVGTGISVTSGTLGYQIGGANVTLGIASNALTLAQLPQINSGYILGNNTGTTGNVTSFATSTLFGTGTGGQILAWNNGVPQFIATTTIPVGGNISGTLSNLTVVTNANLSGAISSVGNTTSLSSFTSANLSGALTDETGSGSAVFSASPTFTGISTFANASTTLFSSYGPAYFGATATSTFSSAGVLTLASALSVANGGMGTTTWQTNSIPYFNGTYFTSNNPNLNFNGTTLSAANISTGGTLNVTGVTTLATSLSGLLGANAGGVYSIATSSPLNTSITGNAATVTTNANLTGVVTSSGNATSYAATAGANTILGNGTGTTGAPTFIATSTLFSWNGTGLVVRDTSPTFTTPNLGTPSALVLTNATGLPVAGGGTGAATLTGLLQGNGTSAITGITGTAGQFPYYNGASTLLATSTIFLATSGNVGIGTTTPDYKLSVVNSSDIYSKVGLDPLTQYFGKVQFGTAGSYIGYDYTGNERMVLNSRYANSHYEFQIAGSEKVRIDNSGNVGIGTTSPSALLAVQGNSYVSGTGFFGGAITSTSTLAISGTGNSYILGNVGIGTTN
ncbi:MAG: hypothetical protein NTU85_01405, partial [Candidatus Kaiserbacteria bacterium]|nr:hypothetical protein [Candidatus Kaiserbacteria bacterium]